MPRKPKAPKATLLPPELLEQFGHGPMTAETINAASLAFKKALIVAFRVTPCCPLDDGLSALPATIPGLTTRSFAASLPATAQSFPPA
jgi:hypothetical protein